MQLKDRISAFVKLGDIVNSITTEERTEVYQRASNENPWFTKKNLDLAFEGVVKLLDKSGLTAWTSAYRPEPASLRTVGVVMAGNIPLVGFHDFLCVLISGHRIKVKLSSQDSSLLKFLSSHLTALEPRFEGFIEFAERMNEIDAVIATGSDNTARYFDYYFRNIPKIIRKNRSSVGILYGNETKDELYALGRDVFSYFGLGCRNISKLLVPEEYELNQLLQAWEPYRTSVDHHKYLHNYDYQKSIFLVNRESFLDNGFVLLKEDPAFVSPVSVVYYERYSNTPETKLAQFNDKIQCLVSAGGSLPDSVPFGQAQFPGLADYSDKVDTMRFLEGIGQ